MPTYKGAIFDVDGVLVDSPHEKAWRESLRELGNARVSELQRDSGLPRTTVFRLLSQLEEVGAVERSSLPPPPGTRPSIGVAIRRTVYLPMLSRRVLGRKSLQL